ncbi:hypothetical protein CLOM_g6452 [Closterium sp. NIES-68]|nr:hypothetical protein CLOM_g6452 [Closterium sp. NIES-68]GJP86829.1 hypothetical protein CLOP_g16805 [Closterium sp. NIES-67]
MSSSEPHSQPITRSESNPDTLSLAQATSFLVQATSSLEQATSSSLRLSSLSVSPLSVPDCELRRVRTQPWISTSCVSEASSGALSKALISPKKLPISQQPTYSPIRVAASLSASAGSNLRGTGTPPSVSAGGGSSAAKRASSGYQSAADSFHQWANGRFGKRVAEFIPNFAIALTIYLAVHAFVLPSTLPRHQRSLRAANPSAVRSGANHRDGASSGEAFPGMDDWPDAPSLPRRRILRASASSDELVDVDDLDMVHNQNMPLPDWARHIPSMTIFCAPKPYLNIPEDPQRRALLSWLRLRPQPKVVLLGSDPSFDQLAQEFPGSVFVDSTIDTNFYGVPLFHAMVARAQAADTPLSMLINGDIILLSDIVPAIGRVQAFFKEWILTASRWDVAVDFPYSFEKDAWRRKPGPVGMMAEAQREAEIRRFVRREGSLHTYGGVDLWVWNNVPNVPLFSAHMPPFSFGRGKYDNWFVHEAVASGLRQVVDVSDAITSIHVAHTYSHIKVEESKAGGHFWSTRKKSSWELFANIHLAETHGTYTNQKGTALHTPWRLSSCYEPDSLNICMLKRERPANCSCEYSAYEYKTQSDPRKHHSGDFWVCGVVSIDRRADFAINAVARTNSTVGLPHTMEQLLPQLARVVPDEPLSRQVKAGSTAAGKAAGVGSLPKDLKVVTLVAVTFGYAEMLMNFVCNLRKLGLGDNLVVAALDEDLYRFAFTQGLAVFYERASTTMRGIDQGQCQFGTKCFRQFTKLKSRAVLRVLKAGYSVLWSDVDIVWFADPLPHLLSYGPGTFPIQSNEPNATLPGTGIRRINSGFYFARADPMTVKAFEAIVAHAAKTQLSEQPSFYDVLCGDNGELLLPGSVADAGGRRVQREECQWSNGLRTIFLPRDKYPNGAVHDFWNQPNVANACSGCTILHNNWISGKEAKKDRLVKNRFWFYDSSRRMCIHDWHAMLRERFGDEMGVGKSTDAASGVGPKS